MSKGDFVLRDEVLKFEKKISELLKIKYVVSVNSRTDALLLAHKYWVKKKPEIITVGHTYVATLSAIKHVGFEPILTDISDDFNIDPNKIEKLITKKLRQSYLFIYMVTHVRWIK